MIIPWITLLKSKVNSEFECIPFKFHFGMLPFAKTKKIFVCHMMWEG